LRVSENRVLRRIFGPNRKKVVEECRRLHNEELHNLYASPNGIRVDEGGEMGGSCNTHRKHENAYSNLVRRPQGKR
jgi:hypothetical protein